MHPALLDPNSPAAQVVAQLDVALVSQALLHALGMGIVLMAITAWIDAKQLKGAAHPSVQANVQNSSNVLFMSVAIATVILLVGNNIARAFALGAAIALIRFKMKLGESSSGSGLLFAILCGMSSAIGLPEVGWILAGGYTTIQVILNLIIQQFPSEGVAPVPSAVVEVAPAPAPSTAEVAVSKSRPGLSIAKAKAPAAESLTV